MADKTLNVVLDEDLKALLISLKQLDLIEGGNVFCQECGAPISLNNLQVIIPLKKNKFHYICNNIMCVELHHKKGENH